MSLDTRRSLINAALATVIVLLLGLFVRQAHHYATYTATLASESGMRDLTQMALASGRGNAYVHMSLEEGCDPSSTACWLSPAFSPLTQGWQAVTLPRFDLRQHPQYGATVGQGVVRYLVAIDIPQVWRGQALAFSPRYIGHRDFTVWVDGEVQLRRQAGGQNDSLTIDLPMQATAKGRVTVAIEGRLGAADEGIFHRGAMYVGPQAPVQQLGVGKIYGMESYYLLLLVGKGAIFLVFAMLFAAGGNDYRLGPFLLFALSATLENLLIGDFLPAAFDLSLRVMLCFPLKMLGVTALTVFFLAPSKRTRGVWIAGGMATVAMLLAAADYAHGTKTVTIQTLFAATNAATLAGTTLALAAAWRRHEALTIAVLATYLGLIGYEYLGRQFAGFDYRGIYDVGLFLFVAYLGARSLRAKNALIDAQAAEIAQHRIHAVIAQTSQMLAHDVRKPLSLIELTANAVARETDPLRASAVLSAGLPAIRRAKAAADAMISDVMTIGSAMRVGIETVPVADAIQTVLADATLPPTVTVRHDCPPALAVAADPHKFRRVLANLIDNAVAATGSQGSFSIRAASVDGLKPMIALQVQNSGSYIPDDRRQKVFEPFMSGAKSGGTGLGLTIVRRFVEAHGGSVRCLSDKDTGTTFELLWPAAQDVPSAGFDVDLNVLFNLFGGISKHAGLAK